MQKKKYLWEKTEDIGTLQERLMDKDVNKEQTVQSMVHRIMEERGKTMAIMHKLDSTQGTEATIKFLLETGFTKDELAGTYGYKKDDIIKVMESENGRKGTKEWK